MRLRVDGYALRVVKLRLFATAPLFVLSSAKRASRAVVFRPPVFAPVGALHRMRRKTPAGSKPPCESMALFVLSSCACSRRGSKPSVSVVKQILLRISWFDVCAPVLARCSRRLRSSFSALRFDVLVAYPEQYKSEQEQYDY